MVYFTTFGDHLNINLSASAPGENTPCLR